MPSQINNRSGQHRIPGADHNFNGHEAGLNAAISNWPDNPFPQED